MVGGFSFNNYLYLVLRFIRLNYLYCSMIIHKAIHDDSARKPNELTAHSLHDLREMVEREGWGDNEHCYFKVHTCRGGGCEAESAAERHDAHGITTGHYCDECYENNYPYRKDAYPTIETHGYGEQLDY